MLYEVITDDLPGQGIGIPGSLLGSLQDLLHGRGDRLLLDLMLDGRWRRRERLGIGIVV